MRTWAPVVVACAVASVVVACAGPQQSRLPTETQPASTATPAAAPEPERIHAPALAPAPPGSGAPEAPEPDDDTTVRAELPLATLDSLVIKGSHEPRFMRTLLDNQRGKLAACYLHARNVDRQLGPGTMTWQVRMDQWGRIDHFAVIEKTLLSPSFEACARTVLSPLRGTEASGSSTVTVRFAFAPAPAAAPTPR
ncbi:MAG: hypothetical protein IT370_31960 [Deltaproteobacteria bacterium]|nr:hypothetical protein [Deltaproteobacteria bacterium]